MTPFLIFPWSKFDPKGLRAQTKDEEKRVAKLRELEKKAEAGKNTKFAKNLNKSIGEYEGMIDKVKEGEKDPIRLQAVNKALQLWCNPTESARYTTAAGGKSGAWSEGSNKCNKLVYDVFKSLGVELSASSSRSLGLFSVPANRPPIAAQYANENVPVSNTSVTGVIETKGEGEGISYVKDKAPKESTFGTVVGFGGDGHVVANHNHVGLSLGNDVYISARDPSPAANYGQEGGLTIKTEEAGQRRVYRDVQE